MKHLNQPPSISGDRSLAPADWTAHHTYFFDDGLLFACQRCGQCCTGAPGTIYVSKEEIDPIARHRRLSRMELISTCLYPFRDSYSIHEDAAGRCLFFDDGCTIYEARPLQCRTFPFWFSNLRSEARWRRVHEQCPGIGRGRRYSRGEIMMSIQQTAHL